MVRILIKKFNKSIKLPTYKTSKSSGMDLAAYIKNKINSKFNEKIFVVGSPENIYLSVILTIEIHILFLKK